MQKRNNLTKKYSKPFVKWAGGKGNLIPEYEKLGLLDINFNDYYEPFLGGGAMFFYLWQNGKIKKKAYLSDINPDLIDTYIVIRDNLEKLLNVLYSMTKEFTKEKYYENRRKYNTLKLCKSLPEKSIF